MQLGLLSSVLGPLQLDAAELSALAEALERPPRQAIRLRPERRPDELPFPTEPVSWHPGGCFLPSGIRPAAYIHYGAGDYYIQDAGSLLAVVALDAQPGELLCDLCAAPGGKATAILDALERGGWLLANEAILSRVGVLRLQLARYGVPRFALARYDPADLADLLGAPFDAVLVDAPCTGQSLVGRDKQTEAAFHPETVEHCAARQARILDAAARLVRPGGRLVYSTCTFAYDENEGQVERFLAARGDWTSIASASLSAWQSSADPIGYRVWPHRHGVGGAFAAILVRRPQEVSNAETTDFVGMESPRQPFDQTAPVVRERDSKTGASSRLRTNRSREWLSRPLPPLPLEEWGLLTDAVFLPTRDRCLAWPEQPPSALERAAAEGPEIAFLKGSTWYPAHGLAMCRDRYWRPHAIIELSDAESAAFLQGNTIPRAYRGWALAQWRGRPLGWVKGDGSRVKNHLPKAARLTPPLRA